MVTQCGRRPLTRFAAQIDLSPLGRGEPNAQTDSTKNHPALVRADRLLSLATAPVFAVMALLTVGFGGGPADALCSVAGASPLGGMVPMYLLMSALHSAPWLKLISRWRSGTCRS
jgi:hypothetical protein